MNLGYWWMKQSDNGIPLPRETLRDAPPGCLRLLGAQQSYDDLYVEDL